MDPSTDTTPETPAALAQRVARLLRHEVGDLLQTVYSTTAILNERLPAELLAERRLVGELKGRAELCKFELDAVVDLLSTPRLNPARTDLGSTLYAVVEQVRRRYLSLPVPLDCEAGLFITADAQALAGATTFLLLALCRGARKRVGVRLTRDGARAACTLERDGSPLSEDQLAWLNEPFATSHQALLGLALALTRRTIEPCGGSLAVLPREDGGLCVQLFFPVVDA
jgi:signal transduction histidine kinase